MGNNLASQTMTESKFDELIKRLGASCVSASKGQGLKASFVCSKTIALDDNRPLDLIAADLAINVWVDRGDPNAALIEFQKVAGMESMTPDVVKCRFAQSGVFEMAAFFKFTVIMAPPLNRTEILRV